MSFPDVDQAPDQLLLHAVANGDKVKASRSLKAGANPNASNLNGTTPVHFAAAAGSVILLELLASYNADLDAKEIKAVGGSAPLHHAVKGRHIDVVRVLLNYGANPDVQDALGFSAMHHCARIGDMELCMLLMSFGVRVMQPDAHGKTPYYWAKESGHLGIAALLPCFEYEAVSEIQRRLADPARACPQFVPVPEAKGEKKKKAGGGGGKKKKK